MTQKTRTRLFALLLVVGLVTGVLATSQPAHATVCCESCWYIYDDCVAHPSYGPCYGNSWCCADLEQRCMWDCFWC